MTNFEKQILEKIRLAWSPVKRTSKLAIGLACYAVVPRGPFPAYEGNWDNANDSLYCKPNSFRYGGYHGSKD